MHVGSGLQHACVFLIFASVVCVCVCACMHAWISCVNAVACVLCSCVSACMCITVCFCLDSVYVWMSTTVFTGNSASSVSFSCPPLTERLLQPSSHSPLTPVFSSFSVFFFKFSSPPHYIQYILHSVFELNRLLLLSSAIFCSKSDLFK